MMFENVISSGCSVAWGDELSDRDQRYSALIAKHYNAKLFDYSMQGASNEIISNSIINNVSKLCFEKSIDAEKTLAIVEWTFKGRLHYFSKSKKYYFLRPNCASIKGDVFVDQIDLETFYENHSSPEFSCYNLINKIHHTQSFLKNKKIKYVFFFASQNDHAVLNFSKNDIEALGLDHKLHNNRFDSLPDISYVLKDIDLKKIHPEPITFFCKKHKMATGINNHPLEEAHREYSKELIATIDRLYD